MLRKYEIVVWSCWLPWPRGAVLRALADLTEEERASLATARLWSAAGRRYVATRATTRRILGWYLGLGPAAVPLRRAQCVACGEPHGKPVLPDELMLHFSVSHCDDLLVVAVASDPVGIDVEPIGRGAVLWPCRVAVLAAGEVVSTPDALLRLWTRKEAALKHSGYGLAVPPAEVDVLGAERRGAGTWAVDHPASTGRVIVQDLEMWPRHRAALAFHVRPSSVSGRTSTV